MVLLCGAAQCTDVRLHPGTAAALGTAGRDEEPFPGSSWQTLPRSLVPAFRLHHVQYLHSPGFKLIPSLQFNLIVCKIAAVALYCYILMLNLLFFFSTSSWLLFAIQEVTSWNPTLIFPMFLFLNIRLATWNAFSHSHPSVFMEMKYTKKGILNFGVT